MAGWIDPDISDTKQNGGILGFGQKIGGWEDPDAPEPEPPGPITGLGRGLVRGAVYGLPRQIAQSAQFLGIGGETAKKVAEWGKAGMEEGKEKGVFEQTGEMIPESVGVPAIAAIIGNLMQMAQHPIAKIAGTAIKVAGLYATPAIFGLSQAQRTKETALEKGIEPGAAPLKTGLVEWLGETAANAALGRILGPFAAMGKATAESISKMSVSSALKGSVGSYLKRLAMETLPTEVFTEMGQNYLEAQIEKKAGIRPEAEPWEEAKGAIAPTALMTAILGPFGRVAQTYTANKMATVLSQPVDLDDPNSGEMVKTRLNVAQQMSNILPADEDIRDQWMKYAQQKIGNNLPIDISAPIDTLSMQIDTLMDEDPEGKKAIQPPATEEPPTPEEPKPPVPPEAPPAEPILPEEPLGAPKEEKEGVGIDPEVRRRLKEEGGLSDDEINKMLPSEANDLVGTIKKITPEEENPFIERRSGGPKAAFVRDYFEKESAKAKMEGRSLSGPESVALIEEAGRIFDEREKNKAATSDLTPEQAEAGNYPKVHLETQGLKISIENQKGSIRKGIDENGKPWQTKMANDYGYILGTKGRDKDHIDTFIGPNPESANVFVVDQKDPKTGKFDEHKVMIGFDSIEAARQGYLDNYDETGPSRIMGITPQSMDQFKEWIKGDTTKRLSEEKPAAQPPKAETGLNYYEVWKKYNEQGPSALTDEESALFEEREGNTPTPEEKAVYESKAKGIEDKTAQDLIEKEKIAAEAEKTKVLIERQSKEKIDQKYPHLPIRNVASVIRDMGGDRNRELKATEFLNELTGKFGIPNEYDWLARLVDRTGVPIVLTSAERVYPTSLSDGAFIQHPGDKGKIVFAHKRTAAVNDRGGGFGSHHMIETFVHEALHAVVENSPNWTAANQARVREFRETLLKHQASAPELVKKYLAHIDKNAIGELISEAFSLPQFASWLDSIPAEGVKNPSKTMWGKLKDMIFSMLETFGIPKTKLDQLNEILDDILPIEAEKAKPVEPAEPYKPGIPTHPQYGPLNKPNTVELATLFASKIKGPVGNDMLKKWVADAYGISLPQLIKLEKEGNYDHKAIQEAFEYMLIKVARDYINKNGNKASLDVFETTYNKQPNLSARTSDSTILQQYSTPLPLAWLMNKYLDMIGKESDVTVYEPTAGNGMLLIGAKPESTFANELDKGPRLAHLKDLLPGGKVTNFDALSLLASPGRKTMDRIVANPPFGSKEPRMYDGYKLSKLEHQIVASALGAMKDDGKAAFIIGGHNIKETGDLTLPDKLFFNWLYNHYNVTHNIDINGNLYSRQGTKFPVRLITIDGRKEEPGTGIPTYTGIEPANTFQEIGVILERRPDELRRRGEGGRLPTRIPAATGAGGPGAGAGGLPEGQGGEVRPGEGQRGGRPEGAIPGGERGGEKGGEAGPVEPVGVQRGERRPGGPVAETKGGGETAAKPPIETRKSALDEALDELKDIAEKKPQFAPKVSEVPYEKSEEETFYQEKMKPILEKVTREAFDEMGIDALNTDILAKIKDKLKDIYEKVKKDLFRYMREEFLQLRQMVKDSAIFQTSYKPLSKGPSGDNLVPRNQEQAMQKALKSIEDKHGNIDDWVMDELQYKDKTSLFKAFSAEQIDALAMAIENIQNSAGLILGDQTGVGKGRVVAGIIRYANKRGMIPIFVTDKGNLFSDMYRDLLAIGHKIRPFIMNNDNANIINQVTGEQIMDSFADGKGKEAITQVTDSKGNKTWKVDWDIINRDPKAYMERNGFKAIFTTYSQHNDKGTKNQDALLAQMAEGNILALDESHKAAGGASGADSNTKLKFTEFLKGAEAVLYSSATFAKTPHNMAIYFRTMLGETGMQFHELVQAITVGGTPLQEYISSALAEGAQYLRRELDFNGIDFLETPTMENTNADDPKQPELKKQFERDKKVADKSNEVTRKIITFSKEMHHPRNKPQLAALLASIRTPEFPDGVLIGGSSGQQWQLSNTSFANVVHNFSSQLLMSIKTQRTIDEAAQALKEGRKVVINLMNTMGSFIEDMIKNKVAAIGEKIDFTFDGILRRAVQRTLTLSVKSPRTGEKAIIKVTPEQLQRFMPSTYQEYQRTQQALDRYDVKDLHSSPIDYMISELSKLSNKPVTEITGRKYWIDYSAESPVLQKRSKEIRDRQRAIRLFNNGESDIIIINQAGSVGISLHSGQDFKDQRPRRMLILQPDLDINIFMQALGRIFRKGQVTKPDYRYIRSDLPAEIRPAVVNRRKMASLKANTTSKQEGQETRQEIPDMMNRYGDRITRQWFDRNIDVAVQAKIIEHRNQSIPDELTYIKASGKMTVLPVEMQKEFYSEIESDYNSYIEELTQKGENDLISKNYDFKARTITKNLIYGGVDPDSPFMGNTYVEQMDVRRLKRPHTSAKIRELVDKTLAGMATGEFADNLKKETKSARDSFFREWSQKLEEKYPDAQDKQESAKRDKEIELARNQSVYENILNQFKVGDTYTFPLGENSPENLTGVLTNIIWKPGVGNPIQLSKIKLVFSVSDPLQTHVVNGSNAFFRQEAERIQAGTPEDWDTQIPTASTEQKVMVVGNMLRAFNIILGISPEVGFQMVNFSREDGTKEYGLLIARKDEERIMGLREGNIGREVRWGEAYDYLTDNLVDTERLVPSNDGEVNIAGVVKEKRDPTDGGNRMEWTVTTMQSKQRGAKYYQDEELRSFVRNKLFRRNGNRMWANIGTAEDLRGFMEALARKFNKTFILPNIQPMPYEAVDRIDRYNYQDTNQEQVIQSSWSKGNNYRYILEGAGDIFRDLTMRSEPDPGYILEKINRIERHINDESRGIHKDDTFETSRSHNPGKFAKMLEQWRNQPTGTDLEEKAKTLNLLMLQGYFGMARRTLAEIKEIITKKPMVFPAPLLGLAMPYEEDVLNLGLTYNGEQERLNKPPLLLFTDPITHGTFTIEPGDDLKEKLNEVHKRFGVKMAESPWEGIVDLTKKYINPSSQTKGETSFVRDFLKSQHDFKMQDRYFGLPWWNAKKYPAWKKAFEIFGIERPEKRGQYMHSFATIAEPFLKMDTIMREEGKSAKEIQDSKERISGVIIAGDAQLGPLLKSLKRSLKGMKKGPERERIEKHIDQLERENRYSDKELRFGIRDEEGKKIKLNDQEIEVYKSVRESLDTMFASYLDHLQNQAFRNYKKQKWYSILAQASGLDLSKDITMRIVGGGLNQAALLRSIKIQPDIQAIFDRIEQEITKTPALEQMAAGQAYGKIAELLSNELIRLKANISAITGETDPKSLTNMTRAIFEAYMYTRPQLKRIKTLRNTYRKQVAYFPRVREQGPYKMRLMLEVKDENGMVVRERELFSDMFKSESDGNKLYAKIIEKYGKNGVLPNDMHIKTDQSTKTPEFAFQGVSDINMQKVLDDAIEGMKIKDTIVDEKGNKVDLHERLRNMGYAAIAKQLQSRGFGQHMTHRQWNVIKGYKENDLQQVLFNYMSGMAGIMTKQVAAAEFLEHMKDVKEPEIFRSLAKYGRDQLRNETNMDRFSNKVRSAMFIWYLGGVVRPALVQITQNFVTGIPKHGKYLRENGLKGVADKEYIQAMIDIGRKKLNPIEKKMEEELFIDGVTVDQYIRDIKGGLGSRFDRGVMRAFDVLAWPFSRMEQFNRQSAALTRFRPAYKLALKEGLEGDEAYRKAYQSARDFVYDTHYAMGKANLPQIAQGEGLGTFLKTLYTFRSFTHNFLLATKEDISEGDWKTFLHSMAYITLFGGLMALPFLKDLFDWIEKEFGFSINKTVRQSLNGIGGKTLETFGVNGLPALMGANLSGSLAIGIPFWGETPTDSIFGVYGGMKKKFALAGEAIVRGDLARATQNLSPEFLRGPLVAAEESGAGKALFGTPGFATTTRGRPIYDEQGRPLSMGVGEAAVKMLGFQPTGYAREKEKGQTIKRLESWASEAKTDAAESYRVSRINKDPAALKNMMKAVKEINQGIRSRGIEKLVPLASVSRIVAQSREKKGVKERREMRFKATEL